MRLFATGAMQWVMTRTLPEDVPIEARMVTKAIERAQNTVEGRNAEQRKDILKYDEVLDKQRKIIYERRNQIIDGESLREQTEQMLEETIDALVASMCPTEYPEDWDLEQLLQEITQYFPTQFTVEELAEATTKVQLSESLLDEVMTQYAARDEQLPGGEPQAREIEREVMLQIVDQRWRDHLAEMDYLREGINLRAMGQQDPLVAWQKEGFDIFGAMMEAIDDDYLRYVMHVQLIEEPAAGPDLARASYQAADDPVMDSSAYAALPVGAGAQQGAAVTNGATGVAAQPQNGNSNRLPGGVATETGNGQVMKQPSAKIGRNEPCFCGSGKKFKLCHGRT
jgi:preprotein translocase subunit SecA